MILFRRERSDDGLAHGISSWTTPAVRVLMRDFIPIFVRMLSGHVALVLGLERLLIMIR